ncbi:flagellar FlbD family protein [Nocardioides sp.]|uniref:flagellar FlbD family protein n=1 Tax=Nocardioides sp. TaxID=35761 RepID=UPI0035134CB3
MISLTRLSGTVFLLNADLVERVDCTPDTVVTLVDGTKYVVSESLDEFHEKVLGYRAAIVARASLPEAAVLPGVAPSPSARTRTQSRVARLSAVPAVDPEHEPDPSAPERHRGGQS